MDDNHVSERKPGDYPLGGLLDKKSRREYAAEKLSSGGSAAAGGNRGGKRYQNSRTITKRKETLKQYGDALGTGLASHELNKQLQANLPEDMRISKLLRRLCQETDVKTCLDLCSKLGVVVLEPCNMSYVRKSFDILADGIMSVLENGPRDCVEAVADVFGMMGYVARHDFNVYRSWITKYYKGSKKLKRAMLRALKKTVALDAGGELNDSAGKLMDLLKDYLEAADTVESFVSITDVIGELSNKYPHNFKSHFNDVVDIVVGWHLETDQSAEVKRHCAKVLLSFKHFWYEDLKFTLNLLSQFNEDIGACCEDLEALEVESKSSNVQPLAVAFSSLLDAFNTVIKCLFVNSESLMQSVGKDVLDSSFQTIVKGCIVITKECCLEEVLLPINECLIMLLVIEPCARAVGVKNVLSVIEAETAIVNRMNGNQIASLLLLLFQYVEFDAVNLSSDFLNLLWEPNSCFVKLRYHQSRKIQEGLLQLYHRILAIKNVEILQAVYKFILDDLDRAMACLKSTKAVAGSMDNVRAQYDINFNLLTLSTLATSNSSILVMWTLQPSILVVLLDKLQLLNSDLWGDYQNLHYAILRVVYQHCVKNNNFISSSAILRAKNYALVDSFNRLVLETDPASTSSPSAEHFRLIIEFLERALPRENPTQHVELLLDWSQVVIGQSSQYYDVLLENRSFTIILQSICDLSMCTKKSLTLKCAQCLDLASSYKKLATQVFQSIAEVCCVHMCSVDKDVRKIFSYILGKLPLRFSLKQVSQFSGNNLRRSQQIYDLQSWYVSTENTGDMRSQYFLSFIEKIGFNRDAEPIDEFLKEVFTKSWFVSKEKNRAYGEMALKDLRCLVPWAQWEAAHLCVNNKLRTPIGKPQETFLKIESIIKEDARVLALKERTTVRDINVSMTNQRHARILLGFLEALEKAIYNAAEGTAFALPNPEKPARTFFRVNSSTCAEWFNRIRTAVDLVALHCMEPEMVIRYSEAVLKELAEVNKVNDLMFEHTLMSLVWALLRNWESDALYGVYVWAKKVTGRKYQWIKMAAEEAAGHRETATEGFLNILADPDAASMDRHIRDFIADQITLTLIFTERLPELYDFLVSEETSGTPRATIPLMTFTSKQVKNWIQFERTKDKNVIDMSHWELADLGMDVPNNFSCHKILCDIENTIALTFLKQFAATKDETLRVCSEVVHSALQECFLTKSREYLFQLTVTNHIAHIARSNEYTPDDSKSIRVEKHYGSLTMMRVLSWSEFFDDNKICKQYNMEMRLDLVSIARKENNFRLCQHELDIFYKNSKLASELNLDQQLNVDKAQQHLMDVERSCEIWDDSLSRAVYEQCKWLYCQPNRKHEAIQFASVAVSKINERLTYPESSESCNLQERGSRFLLTLAEWVQGEDIMLIQRDSNSPLNALVDSLPDIKPTPDSRMLSVFSPMDIIVGKILQASTNICPELAKAWCQYASWCYRWGKKMVEFNTDANTAHNVNLEEINKILPSTLSEEHQKLILAILNQHEVISEEEEFGLNETSSTDLLESLKATVPELCNCPAEKLQSIVEVWRQTHKTVYGYYEAAASAYFRFLELSSSVEMENENGNSSTVTATLRLLRLIVKHALGLKEVLERGLATTPTKPWRVITPQLFSRLNHHEPYVRKRVSELLCRVAKDAPQLIIFPAVVGSVQEAKVDISELNEEENLNASPKDSKDETLGLVYCFNALLDILSKEAPETVQQVKVLVHELRRISLLWDEFWIISLQQIYSEYNKSFINFENELNKLKECSQLEQKRDLFIEKHKLLHRPLVFVLEQMFIMTSRAPETAHERHFQDRYLKYISFVIQTLKEPLDFNKPSEGWTRFKVLFSQMQQRGQKRTAFSLRLSDISPVLAKLSNTAISMPGIESTQMQQILIRSVDNLVQILPTKTKPKKLMFYGDDGRRYSYLFKGLEDLHLDERIMQFLSIANLMMTKSIDCYGNVTYYRAEHYSVIPLGPRSGLINWVDNTVPIFSLYKKWQQREAQQKKDKPVHRPSELYYQKLTPLLQKHGLKTSDNRKDWPLQALKQVLRELQEETPRDLLAKELWCHSTTAATWRQVIRNYSLSVAVMSVIGYIIGLGDRHLDNVLVKLASGEIVHIDYNVCFEKGKTLRVPEKVPFRMTPNLEEALGITGIEGTFRLACEHVLKSLKKGRETLLTLLEAFVYDPLVDWAVSEDGGTGGFAVSTYGNREGFNSELREAKKQLEREVNRDTLAIRFSEVKPGWRRNRDNIYQKLVLMESFLQELQLNRATLVEAEKYRDSLSRQIQLIGEAESLDSAIGSHSLNTLSQRYSVHRKNLEDHKLAKKALLNKMAESKQTLEGFQNFMNDVENGKLQDYCRSINVNAEEYGGSEFDQVKDFLEQSNLRDTFQHASSCRHELNEYTFQAIVLVKRALETLNQFSAIVSYYPKDFENTHRDYRYIGWCKKIIDEDTPQACQEVARSYDQFITKSRQQCCGPPIVSFSYQLNNIISDATFKMSELVNSHAQELNESTIPIDQMYENALSTINAIAVGTTHGRQSLLIAGLQLCLDLNRSYVLMEQTASAAGDSLIDLQLNDNWFLSEFYLTITQLHALCQILFDQDSPKASNDNYSIGLKCLSDCVGIYDYLQSMNECILREFLSDTMRGIISEDQSVIDMISSVSNLQADMMSLVDLLNGINMHLQCVVMNVPSTHSHVLDIVGELKRKLGMLGNHYQNQKFLSEGAKLYLTLHRFFEDLLMKQRSLMEIINQEFTQIQEVDYIDQIKDSKDLAVLIMNQSTYNVLDAIFVVKRVQTMVEFFTSCLQMACAFKGTGLTSAFNDDALVRPVRKFIADFIYHCMLGLGPAAAGMAIYGTLVRVNPQMKQDGEMLLQMTGSGRLSLSHLYSDNVDLMMNAAQISGLELNQATNACLHLSFVWRKMMKVKLLSEHILTEQIAVARAQILFVAHSWLHEVSTASSSTAILQNDLTLYADHSLFLAQLENIVDSLVASKAGIQKLRDEILTCTNGILHRLKWASGANPELVSLMKSFEHSSLQKRDFLNEQLLYLDIALKHCGSILRYQIVRMQMTRNSEHDSEFVTMVERYRKACNKLHSCAQMVNQTEIALVELLDPEGQIDHVWLSNVKALIDDMTDQVQNKIAQTEKIVRNAQDKLHMSANELKELMVAHHSLATDIRNLLKMKLKMETTPALREYLLRYKAFLETVSELYSNVLSKDFTDGMVQHAKEQVHEAMSDVHKIFDQLFLFEHCGTPEDGMPAEDEGTDRLGAEMLESPVKRDHHKAHRTQKEQKRNAYAVSVWRRIRMKLEGRDPDPNRRCTAQEQVDWMIREAMEPDNLAVLYEGWTPWV